LEPKKEKYVNYVAYRGTLTAFHFF